MKKILLFGATGQTGSLVVSYALAKGHAVTALVRNPGKLTVQHDQLSVIQGLPTRFDDVRQAMLGCDAVISTLSALSMKEIMSFRKIEPPHTMEKSIENAMAAMQESGVKRIVTLSSIGVGDSYPYAPWFMRLLIKITHFKIVFADHNRQEALLMGSDLDWTIARPVGLNNNEETKTLRVTYHQTPSPFTISRKQVAKFMVDCLDGEEYVRKAPILSESSK